ncbi:hypothetical protein JQ604_05370 [Bradyrhizobium jicamae]|uniref:hypothetical protein n=1 Tax=Bradyrhizobium jicamae TaxID=280332 RepID=UPI001BA7A82B|nr:hypothetical protein [Bradyrhizobium jicamae]MBR0751602.1 hypothetical protein [Bradyrhizobium jicamae]
MNPAGLQSSSCVGENRQPARGPFVYALIVDGKPLLCFAADRSNEAFELTREQWLRNDLCALTSSGVPLCHRRSKYSVRQATLEERKTYTAAAINHVADDDLFLAFLVTIDS